uniref:Uncharacterized protein n=1 Tax=Oryza brachyantha TaxID=4533 RepID=J3N9A7_ORYBR
MNDGTVGVGINSSRQHNLHSLDTPNRGTLPHDLNIDDIKQRKVPQANIIYSCSAFTEHAHLKIEPREHWHCSMQKRKLHVGVEASEASKQPTACRDYPRKSPFDIH